MICFYVTVSFHRKKTKATRLQNTADYWKCTIYVIHEPKWHISERLQKRLNAKIVNATHATFLSYRKNSDEVITFVCVYEDSKYRQMALIGFDT